MQLGKLGLGLGLGLRLGSANLAPGLAPTPT